MRRGKFLVGGIIIAVALSFLGYRGFVDGATYYYEVNEVLAQSSAIYEKTIRVNGVVAPGSIVTENGGLKLTFTINDILTTDSLLVVYEGVVPDTFTAGGNVVAEGVLNSTDVFRAKTILAKCPSRYEPATENSE